MESELGELGLKIERCDVAPGQVLFIPCHWHHATENLQETLAVAGQWENFSQAASGENYPYRAPLKYAQ
jgi:hypothetical protein